jgi:hypothetical protein
VRAFIKSGMPRGIFFKEGLRRVRQAVREDRGHGQTAEAEDGRDRQLERADAEGVGGRRGRGRYLFPKFEVPVALKKKLAKLKLIPVTIKYVATDAYDKKHSYAGAATIGGTGCRWPKNLSKYATFKKDS